MKIDGIDPLLLNRIQEQAERNQVEQSEQSSTENRVTREGRRSGMPQQESPLQGRELNPEEMEEMVEQLNETVRAFDQRLSFELHEETDRWMIEVWDRENEEVIKEIPPEDVLNVVAHIQNVLGVLLDRRI